MAIFSWITSQLVLIGWNIFGLTTLASATMFANIVVGAALIGVSALGQSAMAARRPAIKTPQAQAVVNQSVGPRIRGYGRALLGGTRGFFDSKSGYLYQIIMHHTGLINRVVQFRVGDIWVSLNGNGYVTNAAFFAGDPAFSRVRLHGHLGADDQAADAKMISEWPGVWTADHRLRGIAYVVATFSTPPSEDYQKIFPEGYRTPVRALCELSKVFDPREAGHDSAIPDTWAWSENASLAILDYLTHPDGMNLSHDDCDLDSFSAFADVCDEAMPLAAGGTEARYRLWGVYQLTDVPNTVLNQMRRTCDAEFFHTPEGKIGIRGGKWEAPTVTIDGEHILGHSLEQGNNSFSAFNELKIVYTSPQHDYQSMEATAWADLADQAERGVIASDLDLDFVPSPSQARRLAKIHIAKANPAWKGRVRCSLAALDAWGERTVRLIVPELEIDEAFYISRVELVPDLSAIELEVVSISEAAYTWSTAEEGENPAIPQDTAPDLDFPVPQGMALSLASASRIEGVVDDPGRGDLELEAEIRLGAGGLWNAMTAINQTEAFFDFSTSGQYQARARWKGPLNVVGQWSSPLAEIDTVLPGPVTGVSVTGGTGEALFGWTGSGGNYAGANIYVAATNSFAAASLVDTEPGSPGAADGATVTLSAGTWYGWIVSINGTAVEGTEVATGSFVVS